MAETTSMTSEPIKALHRAASYWPQISVVLNWGQTSIAADYRRWESRWQAKNDRQRGVGNSLIRGRTSLNARLAARTLLALA